MSRFSHQDTISPDGQTLAGASHHDQTIKLWNIVFKHEIYSLTGQLEVVDSIALSPDGKSSASASRDNTIKLWNLGL